MAKKPADRWDSYLCRVDDAPASISLNMRYADERPNLDTLYAVTVEMRDPADHGMGSRKESTTFAPIEDRFLVSTRRAGFVFVGRLRNHGFWQHTFYGLRDLDERFAAHARKHFGRRKITFQSKRDRAWRYYRDFLYPSPERRQWMHDRDLVDVLEEHGDRNETPRRVDHWIYFATAKARDAFVRSASRRGFSLEDSSRASSGHYGAQVFRTDPVELDHIHSVVMTLVALAERHDGEYDGWETSVEK